MTGSCEKGCLSQAMESYCKMSIQPKQVTLPFLQTTWACRYEDRMPMTAVGRISEADQSTVQISKAEEVDVCDWR